MSLLKEELAPWDTWVSGLFLNFYSKFTSSLTFYVIRISRNCILLKVVDIGLPFPSFIPFE